MDDPAGGRCERCWRAVVASRREADRAEAARHTGLPAWVVAALAADPSPLVRAEIAERPDLPDEVIGALADPGAERHPTVLRRIARHPRLCSHARRLIHTEDVHALRHVAQNPGCPDDALRLLAQHPDRLVHQRARARLMAVGLDDEQRRRLPVGLRHLLA
ncbi:MAG TPA: hypothetical protein VFZ77_21670 [Acidimicrobiales bacterium]